MRNATALALTFVATMALSADVTRMTSAKSGSSVKVSGTSSLHAWTVSGSSIGGSLAVADAILTAATTENWTQAAAQATIEIPVESIKSEHARMDKLMADALKAKSNPTIRYQLTSTSLVKAGSPFVVATNGKLTIAGSTRDVAMRVTATRQGNQLILTGETPIRMSDYAIKPPTAMLGTIKTGNDVNVSFRWIVEAAH